MAEEFELSILTTRFLLIIFVLMYISFLKRKITVSFFGPPVIDQVFFDFWAIEADLSNGVVDFMAEAMHRFNGRQTVQLVDSERANDPLH